MRKRKTAKDRFREECESVANRADVGVEFCDDSRKQEPFYDDGTLHVQRSGVRACFDVDQEAPGREQNFKMTKILNLLGITVTDRSRVTVDEEPEDSERCESCGRSCAC